jgi:hypothetical protein
MKIFILSNEDLTSNVIFSEIIGLEGIDVVGVGFTSTLTKNRKGVLGAFSLLRRMALRYWLYLVFVNGFYKIFERLGLISNSEGRCQYLRSIRVRCKQRGIPVHLSDNFNSPSFLDILRKSEADLLLIRIDQILSPALISVPRYGIWCCHSSLLPSYKGIAGEFHSLRNREEFLGSSVFKVAIELDDGPVVLQERIKTNSNESLFYHMLANNALAGKLLHRFLIDMEKTRVEPKSIDNSQYSSSYFSWPTKEQYLNFRQSGHSLMSLRDGFAFVLACFHVPFFSFGPDR